MGRPNQRVVAPTHVKAQGDFDDAVTFENPVNDENELTEVVRPARTAPPRSQNEFNRAATAPGVVVCILPLVGAEHCAFFWVPVAVGDRMRRAKIIIIYTICRYACIFRTKVCFGAEHCAPCLGI